jgi:hypothetical protein
MMMYQEYAPKVLMWIGKVLKIQFQPEQDFLFIMRSGDLLCRLACALYQNVECHLLDKGLEYGIHKIIFFLELCKSLHIKRSLLFQVSDILVWPEHDPHRKHGLIVLRTIIALEKHARKSGWDGPFIELKQQVSMTLGVSSRDNVIRKMYSSEEHMRQVANTQPSIQARRPSVPVNFNTPPPPSVPPLPHQSRSNSQDSVSYENKPKRIDSIEKIGQHSRQGSQEKDYLSRSATSKSIEFEPIDEYCGFEDAPKHKARNVSFEKFSPEVLPRKQSLRGQDVHTPGNFKRRESSSNESIVIQHRYIPKDSQQTIPVQMIPLATQVEGQNYEDSSDNDSLSDQISEMSALIKETLIRKPDTPTTPAIDHKQMLLEAINKRIAVRSKNIQMFLEEEVM